MPYFTLLILFNIIHTNIIINSYQIINSILFPYRYNISWYQAPLYIQKLILFLLLRSNKTFTLNIGGLFILSIEFFASVKLFVKKYI